MLAHAVTVNLAGILAHGLAVSVARMLAHTLAVNFAQSFARGRLHDRIYMRGHNHGLGVRSLAQGRHDSRRGNERHASGSADRSGASHDSGGEDMGRECVDGSGSTGGCDCDFT